MSELQSKEGFWGKEENELYTVHFYEKVMQLTCFISYLKSTGALVGWNHQQIDNE